MSANNRVLSATWPLLDDYLDGRISRAEYLSVYINFFTTNFKRDYPFIDQWTTDQTDYISMVSDMATPEECLEYDAMGQTGMEFIEQMVGYPFTNIGQQSYAPFNSQVLIRCVKNGQWTDLKRWTDNNGPIMPYLGYFAIHVIALERAHIDARKNKTLWPLLLRHDNDPRSSDFIGRFNFTSGKQNGPEPYPQGGAIGELFKYAQVDFQARSNTPVDQSIAADINFHLGLEIAKHVPADRREAIVASMKGDENMRNLSTKAVDDKIKEYNRRE